MASKPMLTDSGAPDHGWLWDAGKFVAGAIAAITAKLAHGKLSGNGNGNGYNDSAARVERRLMNRLEESERAIRERMNEQDRDRNRMLDTLVSLEGKLDAAIERWGHHH